MGCGIICGNTKPLDSSCFMHYKRNMQNIFTAIQINKPFLKENAFQIFSQEFQTNAITYYLPPKNKVEPNSPIPVEILEKWKIILYGLDKNNEVYQLSIGFISKKYLTITADSSKKIINDPLKNESLHEIEAKMHFHECFGQIEKDLSRTFEFKQEKKMIFQNVLKRIANHFPSMGYTQGINFIVGYLLLVGYSECDAFWMFVHLALNKRYLLLGLYEDGFPLSSCYTSLFKSMLKRIDERVHDHLFEKLMLDASIWVFKWFLTYYIYSFPLEVIKHIWNLIIEVGGIGLVTFAIGIIIELKQQILHIHDPCDMSQFFQNLKSIHTFNTFINIYNVIHIAHTHTPNHLDFTNISQNQSNFYSSYYHTLYQENSQKNNNHNFIDVQKAQKSQILLANWYKKIIKQRNQFKKLNELQKIASRKYLELPKLLAEETFKMQKSISELEEHVINHSEIYNSKNKSLEDEELEENLNYKVEIQNQPRNYNQNHDISTNIKVKTEQSFEEQWGIEETVHEENGKKQIKMPLEQSRNFLKRNPGQVKLTYSIHNEINQLQNEDSNDEKHSNIEVDQHSMKKIKQNFMEELDLLTLRQSENISRVTYRPNAYEQSQQVHYEKSPQEDFPTNCDYPQHQAQNNDHHLTSNYNSTNLSINNMNMQNKLKSSKVKVNKLNIHKAIATDAKIFKNSNNHPNNYLALAGQRIFNQPLSKNEYISPENEIFNKNVSNLSNKPKIQKQNHMPLHRIMPMCQYPEISKTYAKNEQKISEKRSEISQESSSYQDKSSDILQISEELPERYFKESNESNEIKSRFSISLEQQEVHKERVGTQYMITSHFQTKHQQMSSAKKDQHTNAIIGSQIQILANGAHFFKKKHQSKNQAKISGLGNLNSHSDSKDADQILNKTEGQTKRQQSEQSYESIILMAQTLQENNKNQANNNLIFEIESVK